MDETRIFALRARRNNGNADRTDNADLRGCNAMNIYKLCGLYFFPQVSADKFEFCFCSLYGEDVMDSLNIV